MRRSLVLTDERSPHPFLASLPPHIRTGAVALPAVRKRGITMQDLREFLMAYCACFLAVSLYIA
jgi:hypothetical protein